MKVIGKDRTSCNPCNPIDEILARLDALERRASAIVAKVQGLAPDGEGNVTLPTSSSDTDPLHGRIDAFAMSSEVKEAADDAHAYAASIADDVVVINSEIDALNQAVEALQPAEIEAIKSAVQTLQTTVATLESTVATLNNSVAGKVSKSGDNMTGILGILTSLPQVHLTNTTDDFTVPATEVNTTHYLAYLDKNGQDTFHISEYKYIGGRGVAITLRSKTTGEIKEANLGITAEDSGGFYLIAPSWSPGTNDNSDKILTIKMANSLPSLMHTTGNETIAGNKTFTSNIHIDQSASGGDGALEMTGKWPYIDLHRDNRTDLDYTARIWNNVDGRLLIKVKNVSTNIETDLEIVSSDDGKRIIYIPSTPSDAIGNEIATADWALARINELATKNGLNGL